MKIGFWFDYDQTWTFTRLFAALKARRPDLQACGFVINDRYWRDAVDNLPPGTKLVKFYDLYNEGLASKPDAEDFARFKTFDEKRKLARIAYSDRHLLKFTYDQILAVNVHLMTAFEKFLDEEKPDIFIFNCIASQFAHLMYELLIARGVKVVIPFAYGVEDLVYLADNPFLNSPEMWETYKRFASGTEAPNSEEVAFAAAFISRIRAWQPAYQSNAQALESRKSRLPSPGQGIRFLQNHFRYYRNDPSQPSAYERLKRVFELRANVARRARFISSREEAMRTPFVYFPLHYEPEVATLVISQCDQTSVVDLIARQLPLSWRLVLKDHPVMLSQRDPAYYARLKRNYPNVVIVDAGVPSLELIKQSQAVFTLSGTPAVEAAVLGKPVIVQAESRFGGFGLIPRTIDLFNFGDTLDYAMRNPPGEREAAFMVAAIKRHSVRFLFAEPQGAPEVLELQNIEAMAEAFARHIGLA